MSWTMRHRRSRKITGRSQLGFDVSRTVWNDGSGVDVFPPQITDSPFCLSGLEFQDTWDVDRRVHPRKKDSPDSGGPFFSKKTRIAFSNVVCQGEIQFTNGPFLGIIKHSGIGTIQSVATNAILTGNLASWEAIHASYDRPSPDLSTFGALALNRMDPTRDTRSVPSVAQAVLELLKDGIPTKIVDKMRKVKNLADLTKSSSSAYLGVEFGWKPLLKDIQSTLRLYVDIRQKLAQLRANEGKHQHRKGTLSSSKTQTNPVENGSIIGIYPNKGYTVNVDPAPIGLGETWTSVEERIWFAGKGSYTLPVDLIPQPSDNDIDLLINVTIEQMSPSILYRIMPWSWLIDWFTNLGDIVEQAIGHGVGEYTMDYGYLMRKREENTYYSVINTDRLGYAAPDGRKIVYPASRSAQCVVSKTTKERIAATPFGFGLTLSDLSVRQWAILTALGLSRLNFSE